MPRPQSVDTIKKQWQKESEENYTDDRVSDSAMILKICPTIADEQNRDITVGRVGGKNAEGGCTGR